MTIASVGAAVSTCLPESALQKGCGDLQALGVADKKSTKAIKLSSAKQRKQHAKGLWSKSE